MTTNWIVSRGNQRYEAPDVETLKNWIASGNVRPDDQIWNPTTSQWIIAKGSPELAVAFPAAPVGAPAETAPPAINAAGAGLRAVGYLIDVIPAAILGLIGLIPIIGQIIAGLLLACYWLFRDVTGGSLGKLLLGLRVIAHDGGKATAGARIGRNLTLAVGPLLFGVPIIGYFIGLPVAGILFIVETLMIVTQGHRLGDKLAGTRVVKV